MSEREHDGDDMAKRLQMYEAPEIVVTFDPSVCIH